MNSLLIAIALTVSAPASSPLDHAVRKPAAAPQAPVKKLEASPGCKVRDLVQGSGQVKICG